MAWTAPRTWVNGEIETDTIFNAHVRDNLKYLKGQAGTVVIEDAITVAGSMAATGALSGTTGTFTGIVTATVGGNTQGIFSALSGNSTLLAGIGVGRTANEVQMAVPASAAQFFAGSAAGDLIVRNLDGAKKTMIGSGTTAIMTLAPGPLVGIGTTAPQTILHGYDTISGFVKYEFSGVDNTARTVIPNGTGDVLIAASGLYLIQHSAGGIQTGLIAVPGTGTYDAATPFAPTPTAMNLWNVGGNTCQFQVSNLGAITVQRTAGTGTYKVCLWLIWM